MTDKKVQEPSGAPLNEDPGGPQTPDSPNSITSEMGPKEAAAHPPDESKKAKDKNIKLPKSRVEELEKKASERDFYLDHLQRLQAEFDNFRKRNVKEREEFRKGVLEDFLTQLLYVGDNFERALDSLKSDSDVSRIKAGVEMIHRQFKEILVSRGVQDIASLDQSFDPLRHDAVQYEERTDVRPNTIIKEFSRGYLLNGKLIRPSKVMVSKEKPPETPSQAGS